jgi:hypothetical protein
MTVPLKTGFVVYTDKAGELPVVLAFEDTADAAKAKAAEEAQHIGLEETPEPIHVDVYDDRDLFHESEWLLFGSGYALDGDVVVRSNIMYYIIETNYVGPNQTQDQYVDVNTIEISTSPAITNSSHEERTEGWCGTTDGWAVYAHGEYATIEEARAAITEKFGEVRDSDANGYSFESDDEDVVETYKSGKYAPMGSQATADWAYEGIQSDIEAETTDARIAELVAEYEAVANSNGYTLDSDLEDFMQERRQELRDELEDEAYMRKMQQVIEELRITRTALLGRASEAIHEDHKQFFRDRANLLETLAYDLTAERPVDMEYVNMVHDEFRKLT